MKLRLAFLVVLLGVVAPRLAAAGLEISSVSATAADQGGFAISFHLNAAATVWTRIYDGRDLLVREISAAGELEPGDHRVIWDERDLRGRPVPAEAYRFTLAARTAKGETASWDLSDATGGESVAVRNVHWDPATKRLSYLLDVSSRVRIRAGIADGPLMRTVIDWVPRSSGQRSEKWNGRDFADVLDLSRHPKLQFVAEAFALSANTLLVGIEAPVPEMIADLDSNPRRAQKSRERRRMFDYAAQAMERRRDFAVRMEVRGDAVSVSKGVQVLRGPAVVRVDVDPELRSRVLEERFESVYFVDGQFVSENEVGFLPTSWSFDPKGLAPGMHYLTVNLRGYDGHFGIMTLEIRVEPAKVTPASAVAPSPGSAASSKRTNQR